MLHKRWKKMTLDISLNNIFTLSKREYLRLPTGNTSSFINRIKWKTFVIDRKIKSANENEIEEVLKQEFKPLQNAPPNRSPVLLQQQLYHIIKNVTFIKVFKRHNLHQRKLKRIPEKQ